AAGKNPVTHVGKLYNLLSFDIADRLVKEQAGKVREVWVRIVSQIGKPIDQPQGDGADHPGERIGPEGDREGRGGPDRRGAREHLQAHGPDRGGQGPDLLSCASGLVPLSSALPRCDPSVSEIEPSSP